MGLYVPDRGMVKKLRSYDPHLFVEWNNSKSWWDVFYDSPTGRQLVTPVVKTIYNVKSKREFVDLDERILFWLHDADQARKGNFKQVWKDYENSEKYKYLDKISKRKKLFREIARETYSQVNYTFVKKHASKNTGKPNFNKTKMWGKWVKPDIRTGQRTFQRSKPNIRRKFGC